MAGKSKEEKYTEQLKALGIWKPAFAETVHDLATLERERGRTRKEWKDTAEDGEAPSTLDPHYSMILQQGKMIQALRETLCLTPKSLRRIQASFGRPEEDPDDRPKTVLELLQEKRGAS